MRTDRFNFGPPVGFPSSSASSAPTLKVRAVAYQVRDVLRANPDVIEPQLDWDGQMPSVKLVLDQDRTRALGLDPLTVSASLQAIVTGFPVTTVRDRTEKVRGGARDRAPAQRSRLDRRPHGSGAQRRARSGLAGRPSRAGSRGCDLLAPQPRPHDDRARRRSRRRAAGRRVAPHPADLEHLRSSLPAGYRLEMGGSIEELNKANVSLFAIFPVMIMAMLVILMIQLQSFRGSRSRC